MLNFCILFNYFFIFSSQYFNMCYVMESSLMSKSIKINKLFINNLSKFSIIFVIYLYLNLNIYSQNLFDTKTQLKSSNYISVKSHSLSPSLFFLRKNLLLRYYLLFSSTEVFLPFTLVLKKCELSFKKFPDDIISLSKAFCKEFLSKLNVLLNHINLYINLRRFLGIKVVIMTLIVVSQEN